MRNVFYHKETGKIVIPFASDSAHLELLESSAEYARIRHATINDSDVEREFHYHGDGVYGKGMCRRIVGPRGGVTIEGNMIVRVNGATKYWKTRPHEYRVPLKYGLKGHAYLTHENEHEFHTPRNCPLRNDAS